MRLKTGSLFIISLAFITFIIISLRVYAGVHAGLAEVCIGTQPVITPIGNLGRAPSLVRFTYDVDCTLKIWNETSGQFYYIPCNDGSVMFMDDIWYANGTTSPLADIFDINPNTGVIDFTPTLSQVDNYTVNISVFSICTEFGGDGEVTDFEVFLNRAPVFDPIENQTVWEDGYCDASVICSEKGCCGTDLPGLCPVTIDLNATELDEDTVTYSCNDTTYFTVDPTTGFAEWTPTNDDVGLHWFTCYATDSYGTRGSQEFYIYVNNTNDEPILDLIPNFTVSNNKELYEDTEFEYDVNATDPDGDDITYLDNTPLFVINEETGEIIFTPQASQVGNYTVKITADDGICSGVTDQLVLFEILPVNDVPQFVDPIISFSVTNESTLCVDVNVTDEEDGDNTVENLNFTFTDDTDFFDINSTGGFCFTPNGSQAGESYIINISVTDTGIPDYGIGNATNSSLVTLYITAPPWNDFAPVIDSYSPDLYYEKAKVEMPNCLNFSLTAHDPDKPEEINLTIYWYVDGKLVKTTGSPPGLAVDSYEKCGWPCPYVTNITAVVTDGYYETPLEWTINVIRPCELVKGSGGESPGGGRGRYYCKPVWVCTDWSTCMINDLQLRVCKDLKECSTTTDKPPEVRSCIFTPIPTCFDGIKNQDEILADCGGVCKPCPTCSDGICNQGELCSVCDVDPNRCPRDLKGNIMVDCGGPCPLCPKIVAVLQPKTTTWKTTAITIIKISLIILLILLILLIIILRLIRYLSKKAVTTEKEKSELVLVNEINALIKYAEKAIDKKDMEQLKLICTNIELRYNRLTSTKNKKKIYPKLEKLQKAIKVGF